MRGADKGIMLALPMVAVLAAFWFLVLSPKRDEASKLEAEVTALQASVDEQEAMALAAETSRETFPENYRRMVVLGKAVPEDADTSSLLIQLNTLATATGVDFRSLDLVQGEGAETAPAPPPAPATPAAAATESEQSVANAEGGAVPAPVATESSVASLPIGAAVGPAGLPVMPYELGFQGDFFAIAKFIGKMNEQVGLQNDGTPSVFGRLLTVDGFSLAVPDDIAGETAVGAIPTLDAVFAVTTFITPPGEGVTAGAGPTGPAPVGPEPVSTDSAAPPAPPTATVGGTP